MRVWQGLETITTPFPASSVAIGTFDGLHRGHQALIAAAIADARAKGRQAVVFTFDRHPAELVAPDRVPGYLSTPKQRVEILTALGVDDLVIARFDEKFRELSPESFLRFVVYGILGARALFVGPDFRFGCNHAGDVEYLRGAQDRYGFAVNVLDPVLVDGERASSTRVRQCLRAGDIEGAQRVMGHRYALSGTVVEGEKLGRELGYPTANLRLTRAQVVPADGIYAVWVEWNGRRCKGACSIGVRPTVGGTERVIEVYLLDFTGDLYGETLELEFVARLREERKFDSLDALREQIARDVMQVDKLLVIG